MLRAAEGTMCWVRRWLGGPLWIKLGMRTNKKACYIYVLSCSLMSVRTAAATLLLLFVLLGVFFSNLEVCEQQQQALWRACCGPRNQTITAQQHEGCSSQRRAGATRDVLTPHTFDHSPRQHQQQPWEAPTRASTTRVSVLPGSLSPSCPMATLAWPGSPRLHAVHEGVCHSPCPSVAGQSQRLQAATDAILNSEWGPAARRTPC